MTAVGFADETQTESVEFVVFDSGSFKSATREAQPVLLLKLKVRKSSAMGYASSEWPEIPQQLDKYMFTRCVVRSCAKHAKLEFFMTKAPFVGQLALELYIDWAESQPLPVERCYDSSRYFVVTFAPTKVHTDSRRFASVGVCFPATGGNSDMARMCATDFYLSIDSIRKQLYNESHAKDIIKVTESFELSAGEVLRIGGSAMKPKRKGVKRSMFSSIGSGSVLMSAPPSDKKKKPKRTRKRKVKKMVSSITRASDLSPKVQLSIQLSSEGAIASSKQKVSRAIYSREGAVSQKSEMASARLRSEESSLPEWLAPMRSVGKTTVEIRDVSPESGELRAVLESTVARNRKRVETAKTTQSGIEEECAQIRGTFEEIMAAKREQFEEMMGTLKGAKDIVCSDARLRAEQRLAETKALCARFAECRSHASEDLVASQLKAAETRWESVERRAAESLTAHFEWVSRKPLSELMAVGLGELRAAFGNWKQRMRIMFAERKQAAADGSGDDAASVCCESGQRLVAVSLPHVATHHFCVEHPSASVSCLRDEVWLKFAEHFADGGNSEDLVLSAISYESDESSAELYDSQELDENLTLHLDSPFAERPFAVRIDRPLAAQPSDDGSGIRWMNPMADTSSREARMSSAALCKDGVDSVALRMKASETQSLRRTSDLFAALMPPTSTSLLSFDAVSAQLLEDGTKT